MALTEQIQQDIQRLPASLQTEVLHFVQYLLAKADRQAADTDGKGWSEWSLMAAMRGMEDEPSDYTDADLKERFS